MAPTRLTMSGPLAQLEIGSGQRVWRVSLSLRGELAGSVTAPGATTADRLPKTIETERQYRLWQAAVAPSGAAAGKLGAAARPSG